MPETAGHTEIDSSLLATLDQLARIVEAAGVGTIDASERERAQRAAVALAQTPDGQLAEIQGPALAFVAALLGDLAVDLAADVPAARRLVADLERMAALPARALGHELLRNARVWQLPADVALHVQLTMLLIFTGAGSISVWTLGSDSHGRRIGHVGDPGRDAGKAEQMASDLLGSIPRRRWAQDRSLTGLVIDRGQLPAAAVILHDGREPAATTEFLLEAAGPAVGVILDRIELLAATARDRPSVIAALERRIDRLRYDLHDGPQQDVHLLAMDLRLFRDQVAPALEGQPDAWRLLGRLDDLEAQLVALDSELRHISTSMQSPFLPAGTLPEALQDITETFASRTAIQPDVQLSGDLTALSDSQQITLLALVREGLNNVQKHSQAERVTITIAAHDRGVDAQVTDDGRGFDPEQTLVQAAREGHLGVVGIHERVRMLGGHARIESRPGGPTVISVSLPLWKPAGR
ncbi:MAG: sensor histidine kinase [Solirubrobacteraceae bacterium]